MDKYQQIPPEEIPLAESFFIGSHLSSLHHRLWISIPKKFKKVVKNEGNDAFKINLKAYRKQVSGHDVSPQSSELLDDIVDHPEKYQIDSHFLKKFKELCLYPHPQFVKFNKHLEIYNDLEKRDFSHGNAVEMYLFLKNEFFRAQDQHLKIEQLMERDFNILLIILHLDAVIFKGNFQGISFFKYLAIGKIKGKKTSSGHLFWNLIKILAFIELNRNNKHALASLADKVPKDEDSFTFLDDQRVEKIKYAVRKMKENKGVFFLSHMYLMLGAKKLYEDTSCFDNFSLTGLWTIYMYVILLTGREFDKKNHIDVRYLDQLFKAFSSQYASGGKYALPPDVLQNDK